MHPFEKDIASLESSIGQVVLGKESVIELVLVTLLARGHLLIEDVPGVGKTTLALALAKSIEGSFQRIQFTSDLLPTDVIGVPIYNSGTREFEFKQGPIFANIVLADEINRTTPKTQSALLEAMQDAKVTVERTTHELPKPFMVLATQNPLEFHGTYPLPESQLDRFMMRITMGYPPTEEELKILSKGNFYSDSKSISSVCHGDKIVEMQNAVREIKVDEAISRYLLTIVEKTRNNRDLEVGVSPRGAISLYQSAQARAFVQGRTYAVPDDVKVLADTVLSHRLMVSGRRIASPTTQDSRSLASVILKELLETVEVPT